jgi:hypothetical protein
MADLLSIGTWNLEGKSGPDHRNLLASQNCDIWLLTEVKPDVAVNGHLPCLSTCFMALTKHWASILSRRPMTEARRSVIALVFKYGSSWNFVAVRR